MAEKIDDPATGSGDTSLKRSNQGEKMTSPNGQSQSTKNNHLHIETPLIESHYLSKITGFKVYLKMDNAQPTSSFKLRGIGHLIQKKKAEGYTHVISSSGGNAGLAAAYCSRKLNLPATIFVPSTTSEHIQQRLRGENATVIVHGDVWDQANEKATEEAQKPGHFLVHPFDDPDIWEGHGSMIEEIAQDLPGKPDVMIAACGGGGLLMGVLRGLEKVRWNDVPVVVMETEGANCFNAAIKANGLVTLPAITSVAKSLGALTVCRTLFEYYQKGLHPIHSAVVSDKECISSCLRFADDQRVLVEPACGAALAAIYSGVIASLQDTGKLGPVHSAVVIVCGGEASSLKQLLEWKDKFGLDL